MENQEIDLANLLPTEASFKLSQFKGVEFKLTPCTGGKLISMTKAFGNIEKMLSIPDAESVSKLAMFLMDLESATYFKKQEVTFIDPMTGDEKNETVGGYMLLANAIAGLSEQWGIYKAILQSFGYAEEKADETIKALKDGLNKIVNEQLNKENPVKKKKKKKL